MATTATNSLEKQQKQLHEHNQIEAPSKTVVSSSEQFDRITSGSIIVYDVEHLATFSTTGSHETNNGLVTNNNNDDDDDNTVENNGCVVDGTSLDDRPTDKTTNATIVKTTPKIALQKLFELEKLSGIWTQRMQIELREGYMLIVDCETSSVVEKFDQDCVTEPEAFNHYNDIYNNIVVFIIQQQIDPESETNYRSQNNNNSKNSTSDKITRETSITSSKENNQKPVYCNEDGELHVFQCVSHEAQQLVSDILAWKSQTIKSPSTSKEHKQRNTSGKSTANMSKSSVEKLAATNNKKTANNDHHSSTTTTTSSSSSSSSSSKTTTDQINVTKNSPSPATANGSSTNGESGYGKPVVTVASCASASGSLPIANVNVKETVQVFNQIAALREKR